MNENLPGVLSVDDLSYFSTQFFLTPQATTVYVNSPLAILRKRSVRDGFREDTTILNYGTEMVELDIRVEAASDFADLFEVKDTLKKNVRLQTRGQPGTSTRILSRFLRP